jgi:diacylglycerol kinase (ATP)
MKLLVIINPHAGHNRAGKLIPTIESKFAEKGIETEILVTKFRHQGIDLVKAANFENYDGLVAAGGDGTLFEVINGYYANASAKRIPIGVLPIGTGNAFARDLDLKTNDVQSAIDLICKNQPRKVDVGEFKSDNQTFYFLNILGMGFVSDVTVSAQKLKIFGNVSYMIGVLYQILFLKTHQLEIEIDGQVVEQNNIFVEISNTKYTSNFYMAPSAEIDDGLLDVTLLKKCGRLKLLKSLPTVFTGEHVNLDIVDTFKAKSVKIKTNVPKIITPDGEILTSTPVDIECLRQAVEVFA